MQRSCRSTINSCCASCPWRIRTRLVNLGSPGPKQGSTSCNDGGHLRRDFQLSDVPRSRARRRAVRGSRRAPLRRREPRFRGRNRHGQRVARVGPVFFAARRDAGRRSSARCQRRSRRRRGERRRVDYAYWEATFGADPAVVGRTLVVNGKPLTIVGVGPRGFHGTTVGERPLVFVPITFRWLSNPQRVPAPCGPQELLGVSVRALEAGRLAASRRQPAINVPYRVDRQRGRCAARHGRQRATARSSIARRPSCSRRATGAKAGSTTMRARSSRSLLVATGLVLLDRVRQRRQFVARPRLDTRRRDRSARLARAPRVAGCSRYCSSKRYCWRPPPRSSSTPLTLAALHGIQAMLPALQRDVLDSTLDGAVVAATLGLARRLSTLVFGLIPALKLIGVDVSPAQQTQGTRQTGGKAAARFRATLTTAQIALSMALLVLAGWFAQSLANVARVDLGFRAASLRGLLDRTGAQRLRAGAIGRAVRSPRGGARADSGRHGRRRVGRRAARQ